MLTPDQMKEDFYDTQLGFIKIGVLLAASHPDKTIEIINCRSTREVASVTGIPGHESFYETGMRLLHEWLGGFHREKVISWNRTIPIPDHINFKDEAISKIREQIDAKNIEFTKDGDIARARLYLR